jgi:methionine-rich copper-binding protein CopC
MKVRFGLRTLAAVVAAICLALWAVPVVMEWAHWRLIRASVADTMAKIAASPDKPTVYTGITIRNQYCLANIEVEWDTLTNSGTQISLTPRGDAVFVEVPDKINGWVQSADEAIDLLRRAEATTHTTK